MTSHPPSFPNDSAGGREGLNALSQRLYDDLRHLAAAHLKSERPDHTLQPTALVHEAYLKLIDQRSTDWRDRMHFFAVASRIIRRILVDHARERNAMKRGGGQERVPMEFAELIAGSKGADVVALDDAMTALAEIDERQAKIVELRFFGGLTIEEIAEVLSISDRSVDRDWRCAKAWLYCHLTGEDTAGAAEAGDGG